MVIENDFAEEQARLQFRLFRHAPHGITVLMGLSPRKDAPPRIGFFDQEGEDAYVAACREWNGKLNLFSGNNPRNPKLFSLAPNQFLEDCGTSGNTEDITSITMMVLDIDVIRDHDRPSTYAQLALAVAKAEEIAADPIFEGKAGVCISGNGTYVQATLNFHTQLKDRSLQIKLLEDQLRKKYFPPGCGLKLDSIHDLPRVTAAMGTLKMKGQADAEHPYRIAQYIRPPHLEPSALLMETIQTMKMEIVSPLSYGPEETQSAQDAPLCHGLQQIIENPPHVPDRSELYIRVTAAMKYRNWPYEDIRTTLLQLDQKLHAQGDRPQAKILSLSPTAQEKYLRYLIQAADPRKWPCSLVFDLLGNEDCKKECALLGKNLSTGNYRISSCPDAEGPRTQSLEKTREKMEADLRIWVEQRSGFHPEVVVQRYSPGTGKNYIASKVLKGQKTLWLTSRTQELEKIKADLEGGHDLQVIKSKAELCRHQNQFGPYRAQGYFHRENEGCRRCPDLKTCPYHTQFDPSHTLLMVSKFVATGIFQHFTNHPEVVIVDEDCLRDLLDKREVSADDLVQFQSYMKSKGLLTPEIKQLQTALIEMMGTQEAPTDPHWMITLCRIIEDPEALIQKVVDSPEMEVFREKAITESPRDLPPYPVLRLFEVLASELDRVGENSVLSVEKNKLVIRELHDLSVFGNRSVLVLDASADPLVYQKIFPGRKIEIWDCPVTIKAMIHQATDAPMGREGYLGNAKNRKLIVEFIKERAEGQVGIICHATYHKEFERAFPESVMGHYGAIRGSRDFEQCDCLFLVGGYFLNPDELRRQAELVFYEEEKISAVQHVVTKTYGMPRDNRQIHGLHEYQDPRVRALADQSQAEEMRQAAYRIRPLEGKKQIYILSNVPIPGLPPDELFRLKVKDQGFKKFINRARYLYRKGQPYNAVSLAQHIGVSVSTGYNYWKRLPPYLQVLNNNKQSFEKPRPGNRRGNAKCKK